VGVGWVGKTCWVRLDANGNHGFVMFSYIVFNEILKPKGGLAR
jgi:hypothetical protein